MRKILIPPSLVLLSLILIVLFFVLFPDCNRIPFPYNLIGLLFIFTGIQLSGKSRDFFKKYVTASDFSRPSYFINEGIYKKTRNPMYLGMFYLLPGIAVCFQNLFSMLVLVLFMMIMNVFLIPFEEKAMEDVFGDQYVEYKKSVRRWI